MISHISSGRLRRSGGDRTRRSFVDDHASLEEDRAHTIPENELRSDHDVSPRRGRNAEAQRSQRPPEERSLGRIQRTNVSSQDRCPGTNATGSRLHRHGPLLDQQTLCFFDHASAVSASLRFNHALPLESDVSAEFGNVLDESPEADEM